MRHRNFIKPNKSRQKNANNSFERKMMPPNRRSSSQESAQFGQGRLQNHGSHSVTQPIFSSCISSPTYLRPPSSYQSATTASLFQTSKYSTLSLPQASAATNNRRPAISVTSEEKALLSTRFRIQRQSSSDAQTLCEPVTGCTMVTSKQDLLQRDENVVSTHVSTRDIVDFVEAIKDLVHVNSGALEIPDSQMGIIRASVFSFYDLVYDDKSTVSDASQFCLKKLPQLLCNLQLIYRSVNKPEAEPHLLLNSTPTAINDAIDHRVANMAIASSLARAIEILKVHHHTDYSEFGTIECQNFMDRIEFYWMRQRICAVIVFTLGSKFELALGELRLLIQKTREAEKRDSAQTLVDYSSNAYDSVDEDQSHKKVGITGSSITGPAIHEHAEPAAENAAEELSAGPTTYLIYTGKTDAFIPVPSKQSKHTVRATDGGKETLSSILANSKPSRRGPLPPPLNTSNLVQSPQDTTDLQLKSAIARMPASAIHPGDMFIILSGYQPNESASKSILPPRSLTVVPKSSFIPAPPSIQTSFKKHSPPPPLALPHSQKFFGFSSISLARLETAEHLFSGYSKLTVSILKTKDSVGFQIRDDKEREVGNICFDAIERENRVKDALKYGAVRVEAELFDSFFC